MRTNSIYMRKLIRTAALCLMLAAGFTSCREDADEPVAYEAVNYSTLSGTWTLTEHNGQPVEEGRYVYITFDRKEHTFVMYDNMSSMYSHKSTGTYLITEDDTDGYILTGEYDFSHAPWREYVVSEMTSDTMKWTVRDDASDVSVYTRCAAVPDEVLQGSRSR